MIEVRNLVKYYGRVHAARDLSLTVSPGRVSGVLGPNGSGKTTLIKSIVGLVRPDSGEIFVMGEPITAGPSVRRHISYLPQNPRFPLHLTVKEIFNLVSDLRELAPVRRDEMIERFALKEAYSRPVGTLSGGTVQRVASAVAFMFELPVLILDEPSVGLDPVAGLMLKRLVVQSAEEGKTVLVISHVMSEAEQLLSEVYFLLEGQCRLSGPVAEIKRRAGKDTLEEAVVSLFSGEKWRPSAQAEELRA